MSLLHSIRVGLSRNMALTDPDADDTSLRGRTYAIPFEEVWQASLKLVGGGLRRWELLEADDWEGVIRGLAHGQLERFTSTFTVRVTLDENAQTRVDALSASRVGRIDFGGNARRLRRFFTSLDRELERIRGRDIGSARLDTA